MKTRFLEALFSLLMPLAAMSPATALAQQPEYPTQPVRLVMPHEAGGPTAVIANMIAERFRSAWGQPVIVEPRPGGNTVVGAEHVARSRADGHTLLIAYVGTLATNMSLYTKLPYDSMRDFAPISKVAEVPNILVTSSRTPARNVKELLDLARAKKISLTYASGGVGQNSHLAGAMLQVLAGIETIHIPYKGMNKAITDLVGNNVTMMFDTPAASIPFIRDGRLKPLAWASAKRFPEFPDLPTLNETVPDFEIGPGWVGVFAPADTPEAVVQKIHGELSALLATQEARSRLLSIGHYVDASASPNQFRAYLASEIAKYSRIVKATGAKAE